MATNFNMVVLAGHLAADPDTRYLDSGTLVTKFNIAYNRQWKNSEGAECNEVSFIDCESWGRPGELIGKTLKKGSPILVQGRIKQEAWTDKNTGKKKSRIVVVVDTFQYIGSKANGHTEFQGPRNDKAKHQPTVGDKPRGLSAKTDYEESFDREVDDVPF